MTPEQSQAAFEHFHGHLRNKAFGMTNGITLPRACWFWEPENDPGATGPWRIGIAHAWDSQPEYTGLIIEAADGRVLSVPIGRARLQPPQ